MTGEDVWYHGTRRGFRPGGYLMPRTFHGGDGTAAPLREGQTEREDSNAWVYMTRDETLAWVYAFEAPGRGNPKVLVVEPRGEIQRDPEHSRDMDAWRTEFAKVLRILRDAPITEQEAREGWVTT